MADGQQGFQSFGDFDQFLKKKPEVSPEKQQQPSSGFSDFSSFDNFLKSSKEPKKPPEKPPKWSEVLSLVRPLKFVGERGTVAPEDMVRSLKGEFGLNVDIKDPNLTRIWRDAYADIDPRNHPLNFVFHSINASLRDIHEGAAWLFLDDEKSPERRLAFAAEQEVKNFSAVLKDPSFTQDPQRKAKAEQNLRESMMHMRDLEQRGVFKPGEVDTILRSAAITTVDWESMAALFKPMELVGAAVKDVKAARQGMYVINQALGAKFSYDSFEEARKDFQQGNYWDGFREMGSAGAMLVLPLFHHVMSEKGITQDQIRKKAYETLEEQKKDLQAVQQARPNAILPITPQAIEDMQYRIANGLPMMGIGRPKPVDIDLARDLTTDPLKLAEKNLQNRREREDARSAAQSRVTELERQYREESHRQKLAVEEAKTEAQRRQLEAEWDARGKQLERDIKAEKERFKRETLTLQPVPEMPTPEKRPFEREPFEIAGRAPMTREEREAQWVDDRRKRYLDMLQEEREQRRRTGEDLQVVDRRRFAFTPTPEAPAAAAPPTPPLEPIVAPVAAAAPLAPTPQTREQIQDKINASAWRNLELERKKATVTSPEDIRIIEDEMERNRQLAGDLAVDRIAEAMEGRKKPKTVKAGEALTGPVGKPGELKTVTRNYPIRYRVVEGASIRPSHDPVTFEKVSGYPEGVQERNYDTDKDAQVAVIQHTQDYDPNFTLSDAPGPEHGPPMVTGDGVVLGGNSRAMSTMRLYREGRGDAYRNALLARASQLGLDPADFKDMKEPVLVRELISAPTDVQSLRALGSDLNKVFTRKLSEYEQAVSAGKRLTQDTLDYILNQLQELGEGATIRDLLRERSRGILEKLEADGVIAPTERRAFIDEKTNTLNDTGKDFIKNAILGSVVDDPLVLANSPKSVLRKIERSLSDLAKIKARGGAWDITDYLKEALREHISAASKGVSIENHINPPTAALFPREPIHPIVEGIARKLEEGSAAAKKAFEQYSNDAEMDGQGTMAFFKPPVPWESFSQHFGVDVKPEAWGTIKVPSSTTSRTHPATGASAVEPLSETPVVSKPKSIIEEEFDKEVARIKAEEPPERFDLGEIPTEPKTGRPSEIFREEAEKAFPNIKKDQMDAIMAILEARASATGRTLDEWVEKKNFDFEKQKGGAEYSIRQTEGGGFKIRTSHTKAEVQFVEDGRTVIRAFEKADVSALAHELAHVFRRDLYESGGLSNAQWLELEEWAGVKRSPEHGTIWNVPAEEKFARGFERYLRDGKAPTEGLRGVFEKFKAWMTGIYSALKKSPIDIKLSPKVREVFDRMLTPQDLTPTPEEGPKPLAPTPKLDERGREKLSKEMEHLKGEISSYEDAVRIIDEKGREGLEEVYEGTDDLANLEAEHPGEDPVPIAKKFFEEEIQASKKRFDEISKLLGPKEKAPEAKEEKVEKDYSNARFNHHIDDPSAYLDYYHSYIDRVKRETDPEILKKIPSWNVPYSVGEEARKRLAEIGGKKREIEIPEPTPKKRSEFTETPKRDLGTQIRAMSDEDLRSAAKTIQNNMEREITPHAKEFLESEFKPIKEEMDRRKLLDRPERGFGESNAIFTKARADSARERLRKKLGTTFYAGIDPELVRDVSEIMGYYFEGGIREFGSLARKIVSEFGESIRPALREAYETMLQRGRIESKEPQQRDLFKPVMEIILPPGVEEEVRRGKTEERREARPPSVPPRERVDVGARAPERETARQAPREAPRPAGGTREPAPGRAGRSMGAAVGGGGVVEQYRQPLRAVSAPKLDVEHITDIPQSVETTEWRKRLKDANLPENLPPPTETLSPATDAKLAFKGQPEIVQTVLTSLRKYHGAILATSTGTGKCLAPGTLVLMYDGTVKKVEDICAGERLMGPDSKPRRVLSLAQGWDEMYRVTPVKGDFYEVNEAHIISVKMTVRSHKKWGYDGKIFDVSILDYFKKSKYWKHCAKGYRVGVEFTEKEVSLPPYFIGAWLGDGTSHLAAITTVDPEIISYIDAMADWYGLDIRIDQSKDRCPTYTLTSHVRGGLNIVHDRLKQMDVFRNKHIPWKYKTNSRTKRLELLAGLIDTDGSLDCGGYDLVFKQKVLAEDVVFVARSVGFAAYMKPCKKTCTNNRKVGQYYRVFISGDVSQIPVRIRRKKAEVRKQKKNVLLTGIKVQSIGKGEYYGFEIDGDGRFLLGDFTVTHNTYMGSAILAEKRPRYGLIITPSQNIAKQWIDTAELFGMEVKPLEKDIPTEPGIYVTTYSTATNRRTPDVEGRPGEFLLSKIPWNMVIADESHFARRWHDEGNKRGKFLIDLSKNSEDVLYASATPFHTPLELGYFDKLGLWKKTGLEAWLKNEFGVRQGEGGKWVVPMNYRKLAALRDELINRGMFVNLDRQMDGYGANFAVVPMNEGTMQGVRDATKAFRLAEEFFTSVKPNKAMVMAVRGNAATFMKSYLERQRLPEAIELGKKLEKEGWKVIYFTESKKEVDDIYDFLKPADNAFDGEISKKLPRLPNVVDTLKEAFGENLADFTGAHSARRQQDLDDFNSGGKRHLIATYGAGGVGVSLHDLSGEAPRAVIYLGPPWSGVMFDQAVGRPWRFGTKSNVAAYFLTSNAQPEMKLIFQKVLPRFESLKASVSGIKKTDPIVSAMKDLDAFLAYEFGNDTAVGFDQFMATVPTNAISSYKEASVVSAETAKNKGMRVERRDLPLQPPPGPVTLRQEGFTPPPADFRRPEDAFTEKDEKSAETIRRPFVSEKTERDIADPRLLDQVNDQNMADLGIPGGGEKPPGPPSEVIGNQQIQRPGEAEVRREDLAAPKIMQRVYDFAEKHFGEWGVPVGVIDRLAKAESGVRVWLAQMHTSPYVLRQFPETKVIADGVTNAERIYRADLANMQYEKTKILQENSLINDPIGRRKVDQALRMTDQGVPLSSLLGQPSKWLDGSEFKENELKAAQRIRDEIYEPVIEAVRDVRPDVGYRRKYSAIIRTMEDLVSTLHPELGGKVPADLVPYFSLEVRRAMTKDPFSPHTLKRRGEPPKTFDIDEVLEAYLPGMLRVKHYTKLSRRVAAQLAGLPDSTLKEYATKYARIFFGVPSEYKRMDKFRYSLSKTVTDLSYASALEANPLWFTMHLTKVPVNTLPELGRNGATYLAKGYERMMTEEGREIVARSGVLMDRLWVFPETFFELKKRPRNWLRLTTSMSDAIDRSSSYLAALEKAKDMGFLGPKEEVGEITWKRLNELSANGVDISKAFDYANSVMARSEFLYTPGYVQMWQREHPVLGMFKHYIFREAEFFSTLRKIAKEVKDQPDPEAYIEKQVSLGNYEYIDAVAKYRRFLVSLAGAAAVAAGIGGPLFGRFWPFHLSRLLSAPVIFGAETLDLVNDTIHGKASEDEWKRWALDLFGSFTPYAGFAVRTIEQESKLPRYESGFQGKRRRRREEFEPTPVEQFQFEPLPK